MQNANQSARQTPRNKKKSGFGINFRTAIGFLVSDGILVATALTGSLVGFLDTFSILELPWLAEKHQSITLLVVGLIATSIWLWKHERDVYEQEFKDIFEKIKNNSPVIDALLSMSDPGLSHAIQSLKNYEDINGIIELVNFPAKRIIREMLKEHSDKMNLLASGDLRVSMWEAPKVNTRLMELFPNRMDAVSDRDLNFFGEDGLGQRYYEKCIESRGREGQRMTVSRIFIVNLNDLIDGKERELLLGILTRHLKDDVGFGIVVYEDVKDIRDNFSELSIHSKVEFDFALFEVDKVASFFRREDSQSFRVVFSTENSSHVNNLLISDQRKLYKRLVSDCWLVSRSFKDRIQKGLSSDEWGDVCKNTSRYKEHIQNRSNHSMEDSMFPLVVDSLPELESKLRQAYDLRIEVNGLPARKFVL